MPEVVEKLTGEPLNFGGATKRKRHFSRRLHRLRIDRRRTLPGSSCPVLSVREEFLQQ
jgi:hypothetical protein